MFDFLRNTKLFSRAAAPFYIFTSNGWSLQILHILRDTCYFLFFCLFTMVILVGVKRCLMVLICVSQMTNDVEHLFICLLTIFISSLEKFLVKPFDHFSTWVVFFLLFSCKISLYIQYTSLLLDIWFAYVFSHSVGCLFSFLMVSFAQKF